MAMIERVEQLRQLECMFGQISRLCGVDALFDDVGRFRRGEPEFPEFIAVLAGQEFRKVPGRDVASQVCTESVRIDFGLLEDAGRADHCVLRVWSSFALEAEGFFEIKSYHGLFGELQHEVTEGADGDLC